jgi:TIR domain
MSGFVPGLTNDLFISYAHDDEPGWIQTFAKSLSDWLLNRHGIELSIWQDTKKLRISHHWQVAIEDGIKQSAILLAVLSPNYKKSDWCMKECRTFQRLFPSTGEFEKSGRFFKVVKMPWDDNGHRFWEAIQDLELFRRDDGPEGIQAFLHGSNDFQSAIHVLGNEVKRTLDRLRRERERVFLASPAEDCENVRKELRDELHTKGYDVQPEGLLTEGSPDPEIFEELHNALLSVHLLGTKHDSFVEHQIKLAADFEQRLMFWLASSDDAVDANQARLIAALRNGHRPDRPDILLPSGWEFLPSLTPRGLMEAVLEALKPKPPQVLAQPLLASRAPRVYIVHDATTEEDARIAAMLQNEIHTRERMEVFLSRADLPSPAELQLRHRMLLQTCEGVLLCRKAAPQEWLVQVAPEVLLADQLLRRQEPFKSKAFLVSDPAPWSEWPKLNLIPYSPLFRPDDFEPFLAPLRAEGSVTYGR